MDRHYIDDCVNALLAAKLYGPWLSIRGTQRPGTTTLSAVTQNYLPIIFCLAHFCLRYGKGRSVFQCCFKLFSTYPSNKGIINEILGWKGFKVIDNLALEIYIV